MIDHLVLSRETKLALAMTARILTGDELELLTVVYHVGMSLQVRFARKRQAVACARLV